MKTTNLLSVGFLCLVLAIESATAMDAAKPTVSLRSRRSAGQTDRVTVLMEVGGDLKERADGKEHRTAMSGVDRLTYDEMTLEAGGQRLRALRSYEKAESSVKIKDERLACSLSPERQLIAVAIELPRASLFSPQGALRRDELEVIDILGNSLLLDQLLPDESVSVGQTWKPADKTMAALLGLESATRCDVQCKLTEVTEAVARFDIAGQVEGTVSDTSARIELKGRCRFDRNTGRINWFALLTKENRKASVVADGFEVVVRLQMTIAPCEPSQELVDFSRDKQSLMVTPERTRLAYQPPSSSWRISHDRQWYLASDDQHVAVLKRIDSGTMIGQCNASSLRRGDPNKLVSLDEFQADVRQALGENFGEFVEAAESVTAAKQRLLRVVVQGVVHNKSGDVPIRWVYYHVADQQGRQAALTFTVQQEHAERFADADKSIVDSVEFVASAKRPKDRE
ncbi:MAG: hypothetical protein ABFC63_00670 [Thermoguttaceae bacterium]